MHCLSTIAKLHGGNTGAKSPRCQDRRCGSSYLKDFSTGLARLEAGLQQAIDMIDRVQRAEEGARKK